MMLDCKVTCCSRINRVSAAGLAAVLPAGNKLFNPFAEDEDGTKKAEGFSFYRYWFNPVKRYVCGLGSTGCS